MSYELSNVIILKLWCANNKQNSVKNPKYQSIHSAAHLLKEFWGPARRVFWPYRQRFAVVSQAVHVPAYAIVYLAATQDVCPVVAFIKIWSLFSLRVCRRVLLLTSDSIWILRVMRKMMAAATNTLLLMRQRQRERKRQGESRKWWINSLMFVGNF